MSKGEHRRKENLWRKSFKIFVCLIGIIFLFQLGVILLFGYLDHAHPAGPHEVVQDLRFGADRDTLVYRFCPLEEGKRCRLALYDIATGKAFQFETPKGPRYARWPSVSFDGDKVVMSHMSADGGKLVVVDLRAKTYRTLKLELRDWVMPVFSSDGQSIYAFAKLRNNEWGQPDDWAHQQGMQVYSIFEIRLEDESVRRVSSNFGRYTKKLSVVDNQILYGGIEKLEGGDIREVVWQLSGKKFELMKPKIVFTTRMIGPEISDPLVFNKDGYFEGASKNGELLISSVNQQNELCCNYNLFVVNSDNETRRITITDDYYGYGTDISSDGSRVVYQLAARFPENRKYLNFVLFFSTDEQLKQKQEGTGFYYIDLKADDLKQIPIKMPKKFEDYTLVKIYSENQ